MPRRLLAAAVLVALAGAACSAGVDGSGSLQVDRASRGTGRLLDDPASAMYCPAESLLIVVAVGQKWSGGFALRVVLPVRANITLQIRRPLGGPGTATAAFRPVGGVARLGVGGTLTLTPSSTIDGVFEISVTDSVGANAVFRGRLSRIAYRPQTGSPCSR